MSVVRISVMVVAMFTATGVFLLSTAHAGHAATQPYVLAADVSPAAAKIIEQAMRDAPPLPCVPHFSVESTLAETGASGLSGACDDAGNADVDLDPDNFRPWNLKHAAWYPDLVVRHEIAHVATSGHGHDLLFRAVLAKLLKPIHLHEVYDNLIADYPTRTYLHSKCVLGC